MNKTFQNYHFIGIGGIGMSALARILLDKKKSVSGSDLCTNDSTTTLTQKGAVITKGHSAKLISKKDTVIFSSGVKKSNPEYQAALCLNCQILHRSELLAQLMNGFQTIAIAGTHGKTSTSSLLAHVLKQAELDPSFAIGGMLSGVNGKLGSGNHFVAEADESDGSFLNYTPHAAIVTNIENEHLDFYQTEQNLHAAFKTFISKVECSDLFFYCGDDPILRDLGEGKGISYGFGEINDLIISNYHTSGWKSFFDLKFQGKEFQDIELALPGEHFVLNAAAVFGLSFCLNVSEQNIRKALACFPGVARRIEKKRTVHQVLMIDDYAHHPTEVEKTLKAIKYAAQERRVVALFQPHRYSRVQEHLAAFSKSFEYADLVYVTDIYAAGETPIEGVNAEQLVKKINEVSTVPCMYLPRKVAAQILRDVLRPHDIFVTLGAGDITHVHKEFSDDFKPEKFQVGLIFGGRSCEHEISLKSARFVAESLDKDLYTIHYLGIDKKGRWITGDEAKQKLHSESEIVSNNTYSLLDPTISEALLECELFFPILHGTYGEDGTLQGVFEMLQKPYIGPDYRSAAISMDKVLTKRLVEKAGVLTPVDLTFSHLKWLEQKEKILNNIQQTLNFPCYVKPVHLGSSVGISYVQKIQELEQAIDRAFDFDTQVMVEQAVQNARELEFAVMGNSQSFAVQAPAPGEKLAQGSFVDYEKKYGKSTVKTSLHPHLPKDLQEKGRSLAVKAYEAIGCTGMSRVDFLLDEQGEFWFFEMNPIPGLQPLSLFPKIWKREGIEPQQLFDRLAVLALERNRKQMRHFACLNF